MDLYPHKGLEVISHKIQQVLFSKLCSFVENSSACSDKHNWQVVNVYTSIKSKTYVMRYYGNWHFHSGIRDDLCSYNYFRVYYYYYVYFMSERMYSDDLYWIFINSIMNIHIVIINMNIDKYEYSKITSWILILSIRIW